MALITKRKVKISTNFHLRCNCVLCLFEHLSMFHFIVLCNQKFYWMNDGNRNQKPFQNTNKHRK